MTPAAMRQEPYIEFRRIGAGTGRPRKAIAMLLSIIRFIQSWKRYNANLRELNNLGDRELADIGISRSDIPRLAWENATR